MCHPLPIQKCAIDYELDQEKNRIHVLCTVKTEGKTGVEMEALTGVQVTLLTIYDMFCATGTQQCYTKASKGDLLPGQGGFAAKGKPGEALPPVQ